MYITFKNNSTSENMVISVDNVVYFLEPGKSSEIFCSSEKAIFEVKATAFDELNNLIKELDEESGSYSFRDKILSKFSKKIVKGISEAVLDITVKYEISCESDNVFVNLYDGMYSVCDGKIADFFDIIPIGYVFARAEADFGKLKVLYTEASNRKSFLKLMRNLLLFMNWGIVFLDLFLFIPEYSIVKYYSSSLYIKKLFVNLYNKTEVERENILAEKQKNYEEEEKKKGCFSSLLKFLVPLLILGGICFWAMTSEPDVIISKDFSSVEYFDEVFVRIDGGMPENAKDVFLEEYTAWYPTDDEGGYDMDNYYCYIFETPDGTRYMWLKDNCTTEENTDKDYEDYEKPLVYKSVGEHEWE